MVRRASMVGEPFFQRRLALLFRFLVGLLFLELRADRGEAFHPRATGIDARLGGLGADEIPRRGHDTYSSCSRHLGIGLRALDYRLRSIGCNRRWPGRLAFNAARTLDRSRSVVERDFGTGDRRGERRSGRRVAYVGDSASPAAREGATGRTHKTRCSAFFAISS